MNDRHADITNLLNVQPDTSDPEAMERWSERARVELTYLLESSAAMRAERDEALALVRAKQSWIDGMKIDYDALNDEANDHAHAAAIADARAERAEGVVQAAKSVERASHVSERAITNAMAGLRVRLDAYDREDR